MSYTVEFLKNVTFNNIDYDMLLNKYMLDEHHYNNISECVKEEHTIKKDSRIHKKMKFLSKLRNKIEEGITYDISEQDFFFWCWYVLVYGYDEYSSIKNKFEVEKNIRFELIEQVREKSQELKKLHKIKSDDVIQKLGNLEICDYNVFKTLCILRSLNVCIQYKNMICPCVLSENPIYKIEKNNEEWVLFKQPIQEDHMEQFYCIERLDKPLYSMTGYKLSELKSIAKKLGIEEKKKKKELYEDIQKEVSGFRI